MTQPTKPSFEALRRAWDFCRLEHGREDDHIAACSDCRSLARALDEVQRARREVDLGEAYFDEDGTSYGRILEGRWLLPEDKIYLPWHKIMGKKVRLVAVLAAAESSEAGRRE